MVPPKSGWGWHITAASEGETGCVGVHRMASRRPTGPSRNRFCDSCTGCICELVNKSVPEMGITFESREALVLYRPLRRVLVLVLNCGTLTLQIAVLNATFASSVNPGG